ncbi:hypothetical protein [Eubacterium ventriosum]|uniref:hypothetical protein n=1 Tax=Eubacterium ventriosum TaxID=39496 RepID=UPI00265D82D9|nr:hypothetical protein [Eubacterium ventriosum]
MRKKILVLCLCSSLLFGCSSQKTKNVSETTSYTYTEGVEKAAKNIVKKYNDFIKGNLSKDEFSEIVEKANNSVGDIESDKNDDIMLTSCILDLDRELQDDDFGRDRYDSIVGDINNALNGIEPKNISYDKTSKIYGVGDFTFYLPGRFVQDSLNYSTFANDSKEERVTIVNTEYKLDKMYDEWWNTTIEGFKNDSVKLDDGYLTYKSRKGDEWWYTSGTFTVNGKDYSLGIYMPVGEYFNYEYIAFFGISENEIRDILDFTTISCHFD